MSCVDYDKGGIGEVHAICYLIFDEEVLTLF